jgi:hypothetical protein
MYVRIFADGARACGASTNEFHPQWWVRIDAELRLRMDLLHRNYYREIR